MFKLFCSKKLISTERLMEKRVMFNMGERDYSVDMMRSISCFMVVATHVCASFLSYYPYDVSIGVTSGWLSLTTMKCISVSATNLFVMISGIFFLSPERDVSISKIWSKNILKLAVAYIVWCMFYAYLRICYTNGGEFEWSLFLRETLNREFHLWYIPMMIGIYVIVPLLRLFTLNAQRKHYLYMIVLMIGAMTLNTLKTFNMQYPYDISDSINTVIDYTPTALICQYPFYCVLGYYLYTYMPVLKTRLFLYILGITGILFTIWLTAFLYIETGSPNPNEVHEKFLIGIFAKNTAIFVFVLTVFSKIKMGNVFKLILSKISAATLFIYLSHVAFLRVFLQEEFLFGTGLGWFKIACIYTIVIYIIGFILSLLLLQLIPWTRMRNVVLDLVWPNRKIWNGGRKRV